MDTYIGIDIGGTFTDCAVLDVQGRIATIAKAPSTREDPAAGVLDAVDEAAANLGVDGGLVDEPATATARAAIRADRLAEAKPFRDTFAQGSGAVSTPPRGAVEAAVARIADAYDIVPIGGVPWHTCHACAHPITPLEHDPKTGALVRSVSMETLSPWNRFGLVDEITVREYFCPSCAHLFTVEVRKVGDAPLMDTAMALLRPKHATWDAAE